MIKTFPKYRKAALLLGLLVVCCPLSAFATIIVSFDAPTVNVAQGDMFSVDLLADIDPGMGITSFGLDVVFDADVLDTVDAVVPTPPFIGSIVDTSTDGLIALTGFTPPVPGGVSGLLTLATLTFTAEMAGSTALDVGFPDFPILDGFSLVTGGVALPDGLMPGQVNVSASVPEPVTLALLSLGLVGIGFSGRGKRC